MKKRYIHIVDRKKEIIISGGENISSLEVEKAICAHPEVFECAVVAAPDDKWGEVPAAIVVRKPGSQLQEQALCDFLNGRLAKFKMPRRIDFSDEPLPKTGTGKDSQAAAQREVLDGQNQASARIAGCSLYILQVEEAERDLLVAELWDAGATGITEEPHSLRAFFGPEADRKKLLRTFADFKPSIRDEEDQDWVRFAQDQWQPFPVGERFYLVPEWRDDPAPEGRLQLRMHPGMACGTGTHAATRLMSDCHGTTRSPGQSVLDVGTGAGILADGARLLGARPVFGCDIEHDSSRIARKNIDYFNRHLHRFCSFGSIQIARLGGVQSEQRHFVNLKAGTEQDLQRTDTERI